MIIITKKVEDEAAGDWKSVFKEAAKYQRAKVEVTEYSENEEISDAQRRWLHCSAGPIRELMREGWSFREAKEYIKVEYGREWFVIDLDDDNFKNVDGVFRYECRKVTCRKLYHVMECINGICPECLTAMVPIAIKSIMSVSVKDTNLFFDEMFAHFPKTPDGQVRIKQPDPSWSKKPEKS